MKQQTDCWFRLFVFLGFITVLGDLPAEASMLILLVGWLVTSWLDWRLVD